MPLPRLDDDQKYWEERCHALEKELAQAREKAYKEILSWLEKDDGDFVRWKIEQALKQKEGV